MNKKEGVRIMAIYHFSANVVSRGKGQSAVAAAAYRSGERLQDERTGEEKFYHRQVIPETMILAPSHSPEWVKDRERLWNEVEKNEVRKNSQLAREINVALPIELSNERQKELIQNFVQKEFVDRGMVADIAIHRDDLNNPHAHVMLTTREISPEGFTTKNRDWNNKELLNEWRQEWSNHANKALEREGSEERISHLSHEARGLEQLPTVHLGHVIHGMEKRGIETERGNLNRDRQEYNQMVVDLQKYREEKQAIEHEKILKQDQNKNIERFNTPEERVQLQAAQKYLKAEPTLEAIQERRLQIDKWEKRVSKGEQFISWKANTLKEAAYDYKWIASNQQTIKEHQEKIEQINWLNPLKLKENRVAKEYSEKMIAESQKHIDRHEEKLNYPREKLNFKSEAEFEQIVVDFDKEKSGLIEKNKGLRQQIRNEREALDKAVLAIQTGVRREVVAQYPEHQDLWYISYKTALELKEMNEKAGKIIPLEHIKNVRDMNHSKVQEFNKELGFVETEKIRLKRTEGFLKEANKYNQIVEKYEKSPVLKGKMMVSKTARQEYEHAVSQRDHFTERMEKDGVSSKENWNKQLQNLEKLEVKVPVIQSQMQPLNRSLGLLDALLRGIEQARQSAERERKRSQRERGQTKGKGKYRGQSMDEGRSR